MYVEKRACWWFWSCWCRFVIALAWCAGVTWFSLLSLFWRETGLCVPHWPSWHACCQPQGKKIGRRNKSGKGEWSTLRVWNVLPLDKGWDVVGIRVLLLVIQAVAVLFSFTVYIVWCKILSVKLNSWFYPQNYLSHSAIWRQCGMNKFEN